MSKQGRTSGGRFGRATVDDQVQEPADINTEAGEAALVSSGGSCTTIAAADLGAEPAASLPAEPLPLGDPAAVPVELWTPVEVGGGDVVMLCQFTEQQIGVLRVRAEESGMTLQEIMSDVFMRMCDNAWA